jgi:hypothetical protein
MAGGIGRNIGPQPDTDHAIEFLQNWHGIWVLTAIDPASGWIETRSFGKRTPDAARAWIDKWQGRRNLYFQVNRSPGDLDLNKKARREDIIEALALHVDVDPRKEHDKETERQRILAAGRAHQPPPTVLVDSGNGYGFYWRLRGGGDQTYDLDGAEARNRALAQDLGGDKCHNVAWIMRLPGTINLPNATKAAAGWGRSVARVVHADWTRFHDLSEFAVPVTVPRIQSGGGAPALTILELPAWLADMAEQYPGAGFDAEEAARDAEDAALRAIGEAIQRIADAVPGTRNVTLRDAAYTCGGYLAAAGLTKEQVLPLLIDALTGPGLDRQRDDSTAWRSLCRGELRPLAKDERITETYRTAHMLLETGPADNEYRNALHLHNNQRPDPLPPEQIDLFAARVAESHHAR